MTACRSGERSCPATSATWLQAIDAGRADLASRAARVSAKDVIARLHERKIQLRAKAAHDVEHEMDTPVPRF
jgi:hypothetical protein